MIPNDPKIGLVALYPLDVSAQFDSLGPGAKAVHAFSLCNVPTIDNCYPEQCNGWTFQLSNYCLSFKTYVMI